METFSAGVAGPAATDVAEFAVTASFDSGAEEELAGLAPVPNCPVRKTCAALASFDLMSCAGCVWAVDSAAGDVGDEVVANPLPATGVGCALAELVT